MFVAEVAPHSEKLVSTRIANINYIIITVTTSKASKIAKCATEQNPNHDYYNFTRRRVILHKPRTISDI